MSQTTTLSLGEIIDALMGDDDAGLYAAACEARYDVFGDFVHLRGIVEFSSHCVRHCKYCGLRAPNAQQQRYRMTPEEILDAVRLAPELGLGTIVLQSGDDRAFAPSAIEKLLVEIKSLPTPWGEPLAVTLSLGERSEEELRRYKECGADRYLLKLESCDAALHDKARPGESFAARLACLETLRKLGYEVGSGVIVGIPGQSMERLAKDLLFLAELDLHMLSAGPFVPHPETPWADAPWGDLDVALRATALMRLLEPRTNIPATSALDSVVPPEISGKRLGLDVGANVLMPSLTPGTVRNSYSIYPGKNRRHADAISAVEDTIAVIRRAGMEPAQGQGASPKMERKE